MNEIHPLLTGLAQRNPSRYTTEEKSAFILDVRRTLRSIGYGDEQIKEQRLGGVFNSRNLIIGDPNAEYLITAHYDTPGRNGFLLGTSPLVGQTGANVIMMLFCLPFIVGEAALVTHALEQPAPSVWSVASAILVLPVLMMALMIIPMLIRNHCNSNDNTSGVLCTLQCAAFAAEHPELLKKCCFVLFDNEEWGLVGSLGFAAFRRKQGIDEKKHFYINLDCVGAGSTLASVCTGAPGERCENLNRALSALGYSVEQKRSQLVFMSDHAAFPDSVMLSFMSRSKLGPLFIPNIHSRRDTHCDNQLVANLAEHLTDFIMQA